MSDQGIAVVTGGASGIGEACSRELAAQGYRVAVLDRNAERAAMVAGEIGGLAFTVDVGDEASLRGVADTVEREVGPVRALVNSAGILQKPVRPFEMSMEVFDDVVRINQRGLFLSCVAFGSRMVDRRAGAIVNIASISGMRSMPLHSYAPSKAAVISITENLAAEWGPCGVRVNAVSPGYVSTPAVELAASRGERDLTALAGNAAMQRMVKSSEIATVVAFLLSAGASAVSGVNLPVDCGCLVALSWAPYGGMRHPQPNA